MENPLFLLTVKVEPMRSSRRFLSMASASLQTLADIGFGFLAVAALAHHAFARAAVDVGIVKLILFVDGESFVYEAPAAGISSLADDVRAEKDDQVVRLAFACVDRLLHEVGVLSPERKAHAGVSLADAEIVHALGRVDEIAETFKAEDLGIDDRKLANVEQTRSEDLSVASHVLVQSGITLASTIRETLGADAVGVLLASCTERIAQVGSRQTSDSFHLARHVFVEADTSFFFELSHSFHEKIPLFLLTVREECDRIQIASLIRGCFGVASVRG